MLHLAWGVERRWRGLCARVRVRARRRESGAPGRAFPHWATAIGLFVFQVLVGFVIAPSTAWHRLAEWMSQ